MPLFSIIIPAYNSAAKLRRTLDSILMQSFRDVEILLIDACSTDETAEMMQGYRGDSRVRFTSETDKGIYDAMNKGIRLARGRFLYFLGAGDMLRNGVLSRIAARLPKPGRSFVYGSVWLCEHRLVYDGRFTWLKLCGTNICHQAIFYERSIFDLVGLYETKYPCFADWALNLKCFGLHSIKKVYLDEVVADYEEQGISMTRVDTAFKSDQEVLIRRALGPVRYVWYCAEPHFDEWRTKAQQGVTNLRNRMKLRHRLRTLREHIRPS